MSTDLNKKAVRRYFEGDGDGRDNTEIWDQVCDPSMVLYASILPEPIHGLEPIKQFTATFHTALSGFHLTVDDMLADGDRVVARWTMRGKHTADLATPLMVVPPTGREIETSGISICKLAAGKLTEERVEGDWLGFMQQLGVIPSPEAS